MKKRAKQVNFINDSLLVVFQVGLLLAIYHRRRARKNLFFTRCLVNNMVRSSLIIDKKCWINMTSTILVEQLELPVIEHPQPYILNSLDDPEFKDTGDAMVNKQVLLSFTPLEYEDEVLCDVVPSKKDVCFLDFLGSINVKQKPTSKTYFLSVYMCVVYNFFNNIRLDICFVDALTMVYVHKG